MRQVFIVFLLIFFQYCPVEAQHSPAGKKYPGLLWEITGNGLTKPSYLFGTMHVSSKLAFHLSDSFYYAMGKVDVVALEQNPDTWQEQMVRLDSMKVNYQEYIKIGGHDYLNENTFRISDYVQELKLALQTEPSVVNSLLYRTYKVKEDFEEDTFLDLYIYQYGRKLGKRAAGLEDYFESEKIILQAYADMLKEKKAANYSGEPDYTDTEKYMQLIREAYRNGDLDLLDSLDILVNSSHAFREKFIYQRNVIQANSIDSIIRKSSLFAGVGAAHLPGDRGVIALLRKKGYSLRFVRMNGRDTQRKNAIDGRHVPVEFTLKYGPDSTYQVSVPGGLYRQTGDMTKLDRVQYADMANGVYYMVTRVRTHAAFLGMDAGKVLARIDSVIYENIPGKILSRHNVEKNGYKGYAISSRTRRGDLQRYHLFVTPNEIIIFKVSGKGNFADGAEADKFFSSISLKKRDNKPLLFQPQQGGFSIRLPAEPEQYQNGAGEDTRWEYEATDSTTGEAYLIFKKSINNTWFLDEDSIDLKFVEESFRSPDYFSRQISRKLVSADGYPCLEVTEQLKDSSQVSARFLVKGSDYYVVARRMKGGIPTPGYLNTFSFIPYRYNAPALFTDTFLKMSVSTHAVPKFDEGMRSELEKSEYYAVSGKNRQGNVKFWYGAESGTFRNESTGELISVMASECSGYHHIEDSANFWRNILNLSTRGKDLEFPSVIRHFKTDGYEGVDLSLRDTGSSRRIECLFILNGNRFYEVWSLSDSVQNRSEFVKTFYSTFRPLQNERKQSIYENRTRNMIGDLFSKDSMTRDKARRSITEIGYEPGDIPLLVNTINNLPSGTEGYYDIKAKLIRGLGTITDTAINNLEQSLLNVYSKTSDTGLFRNEVIKSLSRIKTKEASQLLKELILQEPPVFEKDFEYDALFNNLGDSLELASLLFPEFMQLASLEDYKKPVTELLVRLVENGHAGKQSYTGFFPVIFNEAVVAWKKQQMKDERKLRESVNLRDDERTTEFYDPGITAGVLYNYAVLLMPFYDRKENVQQFFYKLLQSGDKEVRLKTITVMLNAGKPVADSLLVSLANDGLYRAKLFLALENINRLDIFPASQMTQQAIAGSLLIGKPLYYRPDSLVYLLDKTITRKGKTGRVYFFKYRLKRTGQWMIGVSGLQPFKKEQVSSGRSILVLTGEIIREKELLDVQIPSVLQKVEFAMHWGGRNFFLDQDWTEGISILND